MASSNHPVLSESMEKHLRHPRPFATTWHDPGNAARPLITDHTAALPTRLFVPAGTASDQITAMPFSCIVSHATNPSIARATRSAPPSPTNDSLSTSSTAESAHAALAPQT